MIGSGKFAIGLTLLIDCAQANAKQGIEVAANLCGYSTDIATFERELQAATERIGVKINSFQDLIKISETVPEPRL